MMMSLPSTSELVETRREAMLQQLVRRFMLQGRVPSEEWASREGTLLRFSHSLLNSSIKGATGMEYDEGRLGEGMKRAVAGQDGGELERAVQVGQALAALQRSPLYRRKWAILQFLLRLAERGPTPKPEPLTSPVYRAPKEQINTAAQNMSGTTVSKEVGPKSNTQAWAAFQKARNGRAEREQALLKDLVCVLQGNEGRLIGWDVASQSYRLTTAASADIEAPLRVLAEDLSSVGASVRSLQSALKFLRPECGLVAQGFRSGLQTELGDWAKLVALFESMVADSPAAMSMTLRRAAVWLWTPRRQLALLAELASCANACTGAALLERVASLQAHGCGDVEALASRLLNAMARPYLASLSSWVFHGQLYDPYNELFIVGSNIDNTWSRGFTLDAGKVPLSLLKMETAQKMLATGRTLHFLHLCEAHRPEHDEEHDVEMSMSMASDVLEGFGDVQRVDEVHAQACRRLAHVLLTRHGLMRHLASIRDFLLLARADFTATLLQGLGESLSRPAASLFRHSLVAGLDDAVRACASSAAAAEIVCCLDVRLHETQAGGKQLGWDVFSLDYRLPPPLDAVLGPETMRDFSRLSQFLWLERRVQFQARASWLRLRALNRPLRAGGAPPDLMADWRKLQLLHHEAQQAMTAAVNFSGGACQRAWARLVERMAAHSDSTDLDAYVGHVQAYLADIRSTLLPCYSPALRPRAMALLSAVLKIERAGHLFSAYLAALQSAPGSASDAAMLRALTDVRAAIHAAARQLHSDVDEFMTGLQRAGLDMEAAPASKEAATALSLLHDFNGYHERRGGFDQAKYQTH